MSPPEVGREVRVRCLDLNGEGEGVCAVDGFKLFVPGLLPGEEADVTVRELRARFGYAEVVRRQTHSPHRRTPPCPHFGPCGGCTLMHLEEEAQREVKSRLVRETFARIGGLFDLPLLPLVSGEALFYRNKLEMPLIWEKEGEKVGLYRPKSHEVIEISQCLVQAPETMALLKRLLPKLHDPRLKKILLRRNRSGEFLAGLWGEGDLKPLGPKLLEAAPELISLWDQRGVLLAGRPTLEEKILHLAFEISPTAFFQVHTTCAEKIYSTVCQLIEGESLLDAYCGVGVMALLAAQEGREVWGIECNPEAIQDAKRNALKNKIKNAQFVCGFAERKPDLLSRAESVILNPPRAGCAPALLQALLDRPKRQLLYLSCHVATLARDCRQLLSAYEIKSVQPFDMFPQTMHVETLVHLIPKKKIGTLGSSV